MSSGFRPRPTTSGGYRRRLPRWRRVIPAPSVLVRLPGDNLTAGSSDCIPAFAPADGGQPHRQAAPRCFYGGSMTRGHPGLQGQGRSEVTSPGAKFDSATTQPITATGTAGAYIENRAALGQIRPGAVQFLRVTSSWQRRTSATPPWKCSPTRRDSARGGHCRLQARLI